MARNLTAVFKQKWQNVHKIYRKSTMRQRVQKMLHSIKHGNRKKQLKVVSIVLALFLLITPLVTYAYFARDISDSERLMNRNNTGFTLLDKNGEELYTFGSKGSRENVNLSEISDFAEKALVASEDKDFYEHSGFSVKGILAAIYRNALNKNATGYGGSTITQQLVKNNLLSSDKNLLRKYQELSISIAVEREYSKDEILQMYLNSVYYGNGAFGIKDAAQTYFGKSPQDLTLSESSFLIGILPAPSLYSPYGGDQEAAKLQQERVLKLMVEEGMITEQEKTSALGSQLVFRPAETVEQEYAQHYVQMVVQKLNDQYGEEKVARSGYKVTTSLDLNWQKQAEAIIKQQMPAINRQKGTNAALVAIDPKTGEVRALVGSADWNNEIFGKVNMAVSPRQPGSSFKPIYYAEAIDKRMITAATVLKDEARTFGDYKPQNYDFRFRGDIATRDALANSLNIPAIEVIEKLGVNNAAAAAQRMGISTVTEPDKYGLTLALGTAETKLNEMTNAYAAFANQGAKFDESLIISIQDKFDKRIFQAKPKSKQVQSKEASYVISSILSDNNARAATFGRSLTLSDRPAAVKTGTTNDNKDALTIGYTPALAIGVWVGNNDNAPMQVGGSGLAAPIWRGAMQQFLKGQPVQQFQRPSGVSENNVCQLGKTYKEFFLNGTAPRDRCEIQTPKEEVKKPDEEEKPKPEDEETDEPASPTPTTTEPTTPPDTSEDTPTTTEPTPEEPAPTPAPSPTPTQ